MRASIITPTLDAIDFIDACIDNVAAQGAVVLEHIIVDGGSRDGTAARVAARAGPRLRLIADPGGGQSHALNMGTAAAQGGMIGVLNVDDFYAPGAIGRAAEILAALDPPAIVVGDCRMLDGGDRLLLLNRPTDLRTERILLGWERAQFPCNPSAYFYHRAVHDIVGGFDEADDYQMDVDFVLTCTARVTTRYVPDVWGNFRMRPGTKTMTDAHAFDRRTAMFARHLRRLSPAQRAEWDRLKAEGSARAYPRPR